MNLNSSNRLVRTRMLGGVAGAEPNGSPLCRFLHTKRHTNKTSLVSLMFLVLPDWVARVQAFRRVLNSVRWFKQA